MAPKKKIKSTHELDAQLASLDLSSIDVVDSKSSEFATILKYSQDTYNGIGVGNQPLVFPKTLLISD
jgi:poly [ADP-ribose] polymerase